MMYQAVYDFSSDHKNIISFKTDEKFISIGKTPCIRKGWIYVVNSNVRCGYVPETYMKQVEDDDNFIVELRDKAATKLAASHPDDDDNEMNKFTKIVDELQHLINQKPPSSAHSSESCEQQNDTVKTTFIPDNSTTPVKRRNSTNNGLEVSTNGVVISDFLGCELIECVKRETSLGHKQARAAVETVLGFLGEKVPSIKTIMSAVALSLKVTSQSGEVLENTHDWQRLRCIFSTILDVKSDVEQLNWALYEDQHIIIEFLNELITLLSDGDPVVCKRFLQKDQYRNVEALVQYFHMEVRPSIRQILLKVFATLCTFDRLCITVLINSELPLLLAQDIRESSQDLQKLTYSCLLLTMLMWTGEMMPVKHYDIFNKHFVTYILDLMDNPSSDDEAEQIADSCTELLLAFNLQFKDPAASMIIQALKDRNTAKEFLEKLIMLVNREDDPVGNMFEHNQPPPNSVHKMLLDILALPETAKLFYTNDLRVLIEIIARKLLDLGPDDKTQPMYLLLAYNIIYNTNYSEHCHCLDEFQQCFKKIMHEDTSSPEESKRIVLELCAKFPNLFHA